MHGNTLKTASGLKTRDFDDILREVEHTFDVHAARQPTSAASTSSSPARTSPSASAAPPASPRAISSKNYATACDPRLNYRQALEMAFRIAKRLAERRAP